MRSEKAKGRREKEKEEKRERGKVGNSCTAESPVDLMETTTT